MASSLEGTSHKKGQRHASLNGAVSATSVDLWKVEDVGMLSEHYQICFINKDDESREKRGELNIRRMESAGAAMFKRSINKELSV